MPDAVCNTSPLQYLHILGLLDLLPAIASRIFVPPAVVAEQEAGRSLGLHLPDLATISWLTRSPAVPPSPEVAQATKDLGRGEREVLALATSLPGTWVILDDDEARQVALRLSLPLTGTLGILLTAKRAKRVVMLTPLLDRLDKAGFRMSGPLHAEILRRAGESPP